MAIAYSTGARPFPQDQRRADELMEALFHMQQKLCRTNDWSACVGMPTTLWQHPGRAVNYEPPTETMRAAIDFAIAQTQAGCDRGDGVACLHRSRLYPQLADPTYAWTEERARSIDLQKREFLEKAFPLLSARAVGWSTGCATGADAECLKLVNLFITWFDSLRYKSKHDLPSALVSQLLPPRVIETVVSGCLAAESQSCMSLVELAFFINPSRQANGQIGLLGPQVPKLMVKCDAGVGAACFILGHLAETPDRAQRYLRQACDAGQPDGCLLVGAGYYLKHRQSALVSDLQMASEAMEFSCSENRLLAYEFLKNTSRQ